MEKEVLTKKGWHFSNDRELRGNQLFSHLAHYQQGFTKVYRLYFVAFIFFLTISLLNANIFIHYIVMTAVRQFSSTHLFNY